LTGSRVGDQANVTASEIAAKAAADAYAKLAHVDYVGNVPGAGTPAHQVDNRVVAVLKIGEEQRSQPAAI